MIEADSINNESVVCAICYAYQVDPYSPTYLSRGDMIFNIDESKDIAITTNDTINMKLQYSDTQFTAAHWAAQSMKVGAHFKAFSGAASMAVEPNEESKYHTVRVDAIGVCTKNCITTRGNFRTHPEDCLTEDFKLAIKDLSLEEIESRIGVFYAIKLQLGGMVKRSYVMEATEEDNEVKITAELQAAFGKECLGVGLDAAATFERGRRSTNKNAKVRREWKAQGGDTDIWFRIGEGGADGPQFSSAMEIAREWGKTIDKTNVYPFEFELRPLWELIEEVDKEKGKKFRIYLEDKWEKDGYRHMPTMFLPASLRVVQLPQASKAFIENSSRTHKSALVEEMAKAQGYLDGLMSFVDKKRYKRWRESAKSGQEEALEIFNTVCSDAEITVEEFIEKLEAKSHHRYLESHRYLGLWGNDSRCSNKIENQSKAFLDKIIKRLNLDLQKHVAVEEWHDDLEECQKNVFEAVEWFDQNLECMTSDERTSNVVRAIDQVKDIQESLAGLLTRLENEVKSDVNGS